MTFYWEFDRPIGDGLLSSREEVLLQWFVVGETHFRIFRDRFMNLCVNRRARTCQDNIAIDLPPLAHVKELLLQWKWDAHGMSSALTWSDERPAVVCASARSPVG